MLVFITDIHGLGLKTAQGLIYTEAFYWDLNDQTRAWTKRFVAQNKQQVPDDGPGRRLLVGAALPEGGRGGRRPTTAPRSSRR